MQETFYPVRKRASAGTPYTASRRPAYTDISNDDDELYDYQPRLPTSSIRYDRQTDQGYIQRQLPAPKAQQRRFHPLLYIGLFLLGSAILLIVVNAVGSWLRVTTDSFKYGYPRSFQTDADVGHGDQKHPISHFVAINDKGLIEVVEIPSEPNKVKPYVYVIAQISGDNADLIPVTLTFSDVDGDGKVDMQVHVNATTYTLFNIGTTFKESN